MTEFLAAAAAYILPFILVLALVVFVHEFGHFQVARWLGVKVEAFSIGFGKALAHWTGKSGVTYRIGLVPLGGYVKFVGDADASSRPDASLPKAPPESGLFHAQPVWKRAAIVAAGPAANFIFAILAFGAVFYGRGETVLLPRVGVVEAGSAAAQAGFRPGDMILRADDRQIASFDDLRLVVSLSAGRDVNFLVERAGRELTLTATPRLVRQDTGLGTREQQGRLGVGPSQDPADVQVIRFNPLEALARGAKQCMTIVEATFRFVGQLVTGGMSAESLSGPMGIGHMSGQITMGAAASAERAGADWLTGAGHVLVSLLLFSAVLSVSVGLINLAPIPVLDGGHLMFYGVEAISGKPVSETVQAVGYRVGLACVLALFVFATFNDLQRLGVFGFVGRLFS